MLAIQTVGLVKQYKDLRAVDGVDLEIMQDECFGLLGPNGAGKTTIIRMITAVSPPTSGEIFVLGQNLKDHAREIKGFLGVIPQNDNLDGDLNVLQNLLTFSRYFSIPPQEALKRSTEILKFFELESKTKSRIKELSGGMKRRLLIARGMINQPKIIILDEPTVGLDPQSRHLVWSKLRQLKAQGVTQLFCTQNMDEAAELCDRVAVMYQGKVVSLDTPKNLIARHIGPELWEIDIQPEEKTEFENKLKAVNWDFEADNHKIRVFHAESGSAVRELAGSPDRVHHRTATLEDVFFRLTGRSLNE